MIEQNILEIEPKLGEIGLNLDSVMTHTQDTALSVGSMGGGLDPNRDSDIDVYILSEHYKFNTYAKLVKLQVDKGYCVEVYIVPVAWMRRFYADVNKIALDNFNDSVNIDIEELDFCFRVARSTPIINKEVFCSLMEEFNHDAAIRVFESSTGVRCQDLLFLCDIASRVELFDIAYLLAKEAFEYAVDSFLAPKGECYPTRELRFAKLDGVLDTNSPLYRKVTSLRSLGNSDFTTYVSEVKELCDELGISRFWGDGNAEVSFKKAEGVIFLEFMGHYLIRDKLDVFRLSPEASYLWLLLDKPATKEIIDSSLRSEFNLEKEAGSYLADECLVFLFINGLIEIARGDRIIKNRGGY